MERMTARINITLSDEEHADLVKCYKQFINNHEWKQPPPSLTGYAASIVIVTIKRILEEEKI